MIDSSPMMMGMVEIRNEVPYFVFGNPALARILKTSAEEMQGKTFVELGIPQKGIEIFSHYCQLAWSTREAKTFEHRRSAFGEDGWISFTVNPLAPTKAGFPRFSVFLVDLTLQKQGDEQRERLVSVLATTSDLVGCSDTEGNVLYVNEAWRNFWGDQAGPVGKHPWWAKDLIQHQAIPYAIAHGVWKGETVIVSRDGYERPVSQVIVSHKNPCGELEFLSTIIRDATDQKDLEDQLRSFQFAIEKASDYVIWTDERGRMVYVNESLCRALEYSQPELIGTSVELIEPHLTPEAWAAYWSEMSHKRTALIERTLVSRSGTLIPVEVSSSLLNLKSGTINCAFLRDLRERNRAEDLIEQQRLKLMASAKLTALGEMAAGVAHEINNPLTVIFGNAYQLASWIDRNDFEVERYRQVTDKILATADRIAKIVHGLRSFSRDAERDPFIEVPVVKIVGETLEFCRSRFSNHWIDLRVQAIPEDLVFECRPVQISQVLLNLLNNSFDAVEGSVSPWVEVSVKDLGAMVEIAVLDSGSGISEDIAQKIMQPFFTTKEVGKGTGLGLSIATGIAARHQGKLELDRNCEHTRFVLSLPKRQLAANHGAA